MRYLTFAACLLSLMPSLAAAAGPIVVEVAADEQLAVAKDRLRQLRGPTTAPATIRLTGENYLLGEPLVLGPQDAFVTWEAAREVCRISGGRRIEGWRAAKFNGVDCWAADVPQVREGKWFFRQLWVNGQRAVRARQPNRGEYFKIKSSPDAGEEWNTGQARFEFADDDVPAGPFAFGAEAVTFCRWVESRLPIKSVDLDKHIVSFLRHSHFRLEPGDPYVLEGDGRWLDRPGEWFLDRSAGTIYYIPLPGQEIDKVEAIAPRLATLVKIDGAPAAKKFIDNMTFRGITFAHTEWMIPEADPATTQPGDGGFNQAATPVPAAIEAVGLRNSSFESCTIENTGAYALSMGRGCTQNEIARCIIRDFGAGGIKIGEMGIAANPAELSFRNRVTDCDISDGGWIYPSGVGIWIGQSFDNTIAHNHIHDIFYSGVSTGWSWGYGESLNRGNIIEKNHIHHIGKRSDGDGPVLSDMGAVYLLGARNGSVVRNNVFHDVAGHKYGGWGIYLDEGSSNVLVENNLVYRTTHGGFHLHYGKDNTVRNNIFAVARQWQIQRSREEEHIGFTFEHNIVYFTAGPLINTPATNLVFDHNLYGPIAANDLRTAHVSYEQWQAAGMDRHSVVADPGFVDPSNGDFALTNDDLAKRIGFVRFDTSDVGPRKSAARSPAR